MAIPFLAHLGVFDTVISVSITNSDHNLESSSERGPVEYSGKTVQKPDIGHLERRSRRQMHMTKHMTQLGISVQD